MGHHLNLQAWHNHFTLLQEKSWVALITSTEKEVGLNPILTLSPKPRYFHDKTFQGDLCSAELSIYTSGLFFGVQHSQIARESWDAALPSQSLGMLALSDSIKCCSVFCDSHGQKSLETSSKLSGKKSFSKHFQKLKINY